jgi:hypothetical protein
LPLSCIFQAKPCQLDKKGKSQELTDKIQTAINQKSLGYDCRCFFTFRETITSGTKRNLVQVDGMQKYFTTTKL